jgi:hypothetical protein
VCDAIRESSAVPFAIQPYEEDFELAKSRQETLAKFFSEKLYIPQTQIVLSNPANPQKRGTAIAIVSNATPGGASR